MAHGWTSPGASRRGAVLAVVLAAVGMTSCGGSSEEDNYPVLFEQYGGTGSWPESALNMTRFDQTFTTSDGEIWKLNCEGIIRVTSQNQSAWSGQVERGVHHWGIDEPCRSSGGMTGEVGMDGSIRFTLTQERWGGCSAVGPGEYTGQLFGNRFYATGTTPLLCDDGREGIVQEVVSGSHPAPDGSHDI